MTDGTLLGTFKSYPDVADTCWSDHATDLVFDLPSNQFFAHGQVLIIMQNANGFNPDVEIWGDENPGGKCKGEAS